METSVCNWIRASNTSQRQLKIDDEGTRLSDRRNVNESNIACKIILDIGIWSTCIETSKHATIIASALNRVGNITTSLVAYEVKLPIMYRIIWGSWTLFHRELLRSILSLISMEFYYWNQCNNLNSLWNRVLDTYHVWIRTTRSFCSIEVVQQESPNWWRVYMYIKWFTRNLFRTRMH